MCDCRTRIEAMLKDRHAEQTPDAKDHAATLQGYGFGITAENGVREIAFMPAELSSTVTVKKTGLDKPKKTSLNMYFTFCPFCGVKFA